jgi:mannosyltransferase OCH1-like enzyme
MIPHKFHRVWVAESGPMPDVFAGYGQTWLDLNPGWASYVWDQFPSWGVNRHEWEIAETFSEKADVLRYEVIYKCGGVYIDTDFENFLPIGDLIDLSPHGFIACPEFIRGGAIHFAAGFFAATAGHPILAEIIEKMPESFARNNHPTTRAGPTYLQSILHRHLGEITIVPAELFYPYHGGEVWRHEDHPNAMAAHHWAASWRK